MDARKCPQCGKEVKGRAGKIFCSTECKNRYNNGRLSRSRKCRCTVIENLDRNHSILDLLIKGGVSSISMENVTGMGFNADCFTGWSRDKFGHNRFSCFDISYCRSASKIFGIRMEE